MLAARRGLATLLTDWPQIAAKSRGRALASVEVLGAFRAPWAVKAALAPRTTT